MGMELPKVLAENLRIGFLFLPRSINGEWRWWQHAAWVEQLIQFPLDEPFWIDTRWINIQ